MDGKLIVLEGMDGTGKSTQASRLCGRLEALGIPAAQSAEPTDGTVGRMIRRVLGGEELLSPAALAALFLSDRVEHNTKPETGIRAALSRGVTMISDRYYYSSVAYQGEGALFEWVLRQNLDCPDIRRPDLCVFLDMAPERCMERVARRQDGRDMFENTASLTRVRAAFHRVFARLGDVQNIVLIDADAPAEEVGEQILRAALAIF